MQLDRQDLIDGLRGVVTAARADGVIGVSIRIVGGAALRLAYFDRETTADIDAQIEPMDRLAPIIERIAGQRGWPSTWLNNDARPGRDTEDIAKLLVLNGVTTAARADELSESFYPGDALPKRTVELIGRMIGSGLPRAPIAQPSPDFN